jgi:hypothetical protein
VHIPFACNQTRSETSVYPHAAESFFRDLKQEWPVTWVKFSPQQNNIYTDTPNSFSKVCVIQVQHHVLRQHLLVAEGTLSRWNISNFVLVCRFHPFIGHEGPRESRGISLLYFWPRHKKGVRGQRQAPAAPYPRERPGTHCAGGWMGLRGRSGQVRKILSPPGFDPRTVQPLGSRYTDYATRIWIWSPCHYSINNHNNAWVTLKGKIFSVVSPQFSLNSVSFLVCISMHSVCINL